MIKIKIPDYQNTEDSIIQDTRLFLQEIVGSYIEINIQNNIPKYELFLNQHMLKHNGLSDNIRCYTENSIPNKTTVGMPKFIPKLNSE
jgi:hypothetical protein